MSARLPMPPDLKRLSNRELDQLYQRLQKEAFAQFDAAAERAESGRAPSEQASADARARAEPLIRQAAEVSAERARRLRRTARTFRWLALVAAALTVAVIALALLRAQ